MREQRILISVLASAWALVCLLILAGGLSHAQEPEPLGVVDLLNVDVVDDNINVQGQLVSGGSPVNGSVNVTFCLYSVSIGGLPLWSDIQSVTADNGYFSEELDVDQALFNGQPLWLGVQVAGDSEMSPRQKILPVPYALGVVPGASVYGSELSSILTISNTGSISGTSDIGNDATFSSLAGVRIYSKGDYTYPDPYNGHRTLGVGLYSYGEVVGVHGLSDQGTAGRFISTDGTGVYAKGNVAVGGFAGPSGTGVVGHSGYASGMSWPGVGVLGNSATGIGVAATTASSSDPALWVQNSTTGDLIHAYSGSGTGSDLRFKVHNDGDVTADGTFTGGGADYADLMSVEGDVNDYEPGDVLVISDSEDGAVELSTEAYSSAVIGIYSTQPGFVGGGNNRDGIPVALVGVVPCKVSAEKGPIQRGDLLTTFSTPGHAMKVTDRSNAIGAILGKALAPLDAGTGVILVLVMLQ